MVCLLVPAVSVPLVGFGNGSSIHFETALEFCEVYNGASATALLRNAGPAEACICLIPQSPMVTCSPQEVIVPAGQEVPITFLFDGIKKAGFYREEIEMTSVENGMREALKLLGAIGPEEKFYDFSITR
jgi:hypothetical protein